MSVVVRTPPDEAQWVEIRFLHAVIERLPHDRQALSSLATLYTETGLYEQGLPLDRRLVLLYPDDPGVHYDLACSLSLLGEHQEALHELAQALLLGFEKVEWMLRDDDLEALHGDPEFLRLVGQHINRQRDA